jgi:hypothetical protein
MVEDRPIDYRSGPKFEVLREQAAILVTFGFDYPLNATPAIDALLVFL